MPPACAARATRASGTSEASSWLASRPYRPRSTARATESSKARVSGGTRSDRSTNTPPERPFAELRARLAGANQRFEFVLEILDVGRSALVQDDHVEGQAFHAPIIGCLQQIARDAEMLDVGDAQTR